MNRIAIWDTTSFCNLRCAHCYNQERYWENAKKYASLSQENISTIVKKLSLLGFSRLHLLGGEPLLAPNLLDFVHEGRKYGMAVSMVTNGTLLTAERMLELCEAGVTSISVSLDGTSAEANDAIRGLGSFDRAVANLRECAKVRDQYNSRNGISDRVYIGISFTLTRKNYETSANITSFASNLGMDGINISYLSEEGQARGAFYSLALQEDEKIAFLDKVMEEVKKHRELEVNIDSRGYLGEYLYKKHGHRIESAENGCAGGDGQFYILADGTLLPCSPAGTSMGSCVAEKHLIGLTPPNLLADTVDDIIKSNYLISFYNFAHSYETYKTTFPCNTCEYECLPCPLLYGDGRTPVEECIYAMNQINKLNENVLNTVIKKNMYLRIKNHENFVEILSFDSGGTYILEGTAYAIWEQIDNKKTGQDIVMSIYEQYKSSVSEAELRADILEYLYELRSLGIIEELLTVSEEGRVNEVDHD